MERHFVCDSSAAAVMTTRGKVRGYLCNDIFTFKGIPYAKARRFHAPKPAERWEGELDATSYGYVCPLLELPKPGGELCVPHRYWLMDEDCQNLNVWTPGCDGEKRPVLVWLHGGGYEAGSAIEQVAYEGGNMARCGQVVVVSVNHRLNILGYLDLSDFGEEYANSGNAGTDDIIAALWWVRDNIAAFGGDPENVTVFGQSGGGAKVTTLLQTPAADGLYAKGINMSGVTGPLLADSKGSGKETVLALMKELGLETVKDLETVPYYLLASAYRKVKPKLAEAGANVGCTPHPNEYYLGTPDENGFRKETAQIPLLVGSVFGEFGTFTEPTFCKNKMTFEEGAAAVESVLGQEGAARLLPLFAKAYPDRNPAELLVLDFIFRAPGMAYIRQRSAQNSSTYSYLFVQDMMLGGGRAPWHCADIPYVFHNTELVPVTWKEGVTSRLEEQIFGCVMAFARTGDPNCAQIPHWPASTPKTEQTMIFGENTYLSPDHDAELIPLLAKYMKPVMERQMDDMMDHVQH